MYTDAPVTHFGRGIPAAEPMPFTATSAAVAIQNYYDEEQ